MSKLLKLKGADDWFGKIKLGPYRQKKARFCRDRDVSAAWFALLQAAVDRHRAGEPVKPETAKALPRRLLEAFGLVSALAGKRRGSYAENVEDYVSELRTAGRDAKYIANAANTLTALGDKCGWKRLDDVGRDALARHLADRKADGASPRTLKNIRAAAVAFCRWALAAKRLDANPLDSIPLPDCRTDRRRQRRALTPDEVGRLLRVAGPRELLYRVALGTGLRLGELAALQWRDVRVDNTIRPRLELRPEATKGRRADVLPLSAALAARLKEARPDDGAPTDRVFRTVPRFPTWQADMKRAGIEYRDGPVLTVGFHSLRVTFCSELERAGVSPRTIMELMRHRDYKLTAGTYTDRRVLDPAGAVAKLPEYPIPDAQEARRTGTDDLPVGPVGPQDQIRDQIPVAGVRSGARRGTAGGGANGRETAGKAGFTRGNLERQELGAVGFEPT